MIEHKVGETFEYITPHVKVLLKVEEDTKMSCSGCYFERMSCVDVETCVYEYREDGTTVIFKEVKQETEET